MKYQIAIPFSTELRLVATLPKKAVVVPAAHMSIYVSFHQHAPSAGFQIGLAAAVFAFVHGVPHC